jgi:hypothetical protein
MGGQELGSLGPLPPHALFGKLFSRLAGRITEIPISQDCILSQDPGASSIQHTVCILVQARSNITFKTGTQPLRRVYVADFRAASQDWRAAPKGRPH